MKKAIILNLVFFLTVSTAAISQTRLVPDEYSTIQAAIDVAVDGDEVVVADGVYTGEGNRDIDFLGKAITVRSTEPNDQNTVAVTIIDCESVGRGFYFRTGEDNNSVLDGFTITNGYATDGDPGTGGIEDCGGGILCWEGSPTINNCIIIGNWAELFGGGINCESGNPMIVNCKITGNSADWWGGGLDCGGNTTIVNCVIENNRHVGIYCSGGTTVDKCVVKNNTGGGIICRGGQSTITNCKIIGNHSGEYQPPVGSAGGAGISCVGVGPKSVFKITNCTITGNESKRAHGYGGGVYSVLYKGGNFEITNCLITQNIADRGAGLAIHLGDRNSVTIANCTVSGNSASEYAGGIYFSEWGNPIITNSIFWGNNAPSAPEIYSDADNNLCISYSNVKGGWPGQGNIDADPCFVDPGYWADVNDTNIIVEPNDPNAIWVEGDYHLWEDSPCINAGDPNYIAGPDETDLDGLPRVIDGRIDMGAYEYWPPVQAEIKITPQMLNCKSKGNWLKAHFVLPQGLSPEDVDVNEPAFAELLDMEIDSEYVRILSSDDGQLRLEIAFDRQAFCELLIEDNSIMPNDDTLEITVTGFLTTGRYFYGCDTIRIKRHPNWP